MAESEFTPTQQRILNLLSDGISHTREELLKCLDDELGDLRTLRVHLSNVRKKIKNTGQDVVCEMHSEITYYRIVRLVSNAE